jgi:hypothetical protein
MLVLLKNTKLSAVLKKHQFFLKKLKLFLAHYHKPLKYQQNLYI